MKQIWVVSILVCSQIIGCTLSGTVVDCGNFETTLSHVELKKYPALHVYYSGGKRMIKLNMINTVIIDPSFTMTVDNELYFSADITLRNGVRLRSLDKDETKLTKAYISVQDVLTGKNENDQFAIGLENVLRITIK